MIFSSFFKDSVHEREVREPAVAGMFYPGDASQLRRVIEEFLDEADKIIDKPIRGLVSPHAGYMYSGPVAAWAYKQIEGQSFDLVVVISPSHFEYFRGASVYSGEFYLTPLGEIPVATSIAQELAKRTPYLQFSEYGHRVDFSGRGEHALEVQLPFLQIVLGKFQLIPIVMAEQDWEVVEAVGQALHEQFKGDNVLYVASSDLSHYYPYQVAYELDGRLMDYFKSYDYKGLLQAVATRSVEACGAGPIATVMYASHLDGYPKATVLRYATSGDVPVGEKSQVVGYMAGALHK